MDITEGDSIGRYPSFHFDLHSITPLHQFLHRGLPGGRQRVNLLIAVLDVEGPSSVTTKKGEEVGIMKLIVGDETGEITKIAVWRETAFIWGGETVVSNDDALRKGDVVYLEGRQPTIDSTFASDTDFQASLLLPVFQGVQSCFRLHQPTAQR